MFQPLTLSDDFRYALDLLEKTDRSLFITGRAGTGKSTLLRLFQQTTKKKSIVLAPTGVAALNVGGQTIHSFFGFHPRILTAKDIKRGSRPKLYAALEVIIIDEISMVRADVLDGIDKFLRLNRGDHRPFGGVQMVFFGDLFQLPPVISQDPVERQFFTDFYDTAYFFSAKCLAEQDLEFEMIELKKIYRQEARHFIRLLEAVRLNEIDRDDLDDLNERHEPERILGEGFITLTAQNAVADRINQAEILKLKGAEQTFLAEIKGDFSEKQFPTDPILRLREGAQVMFCKNDPDREFVNGTIGKITKLRSDEISVQVEDLDGKRRTLRVAPLTWEIIRYNADGEEGIKAEPIGSFAQYPLKLAWAITIHKSQGKTFERVAIDLGRGAFESGQVYVALSRCRTLEGIVLRQKLRPQDIMTDERVVDFYARQFR